MFPFINPTPIIMSIAATFGVLLHDTHIDSAAITAMTLPTVAVVAAADSKLRADSHTHAERGVIRAVSNHQPAMQPRNDSDRKYFLQRRFTSDSLGNHYIWPSV